MSTTDSSPSAPALSDRVYGIVAALALLAALAYAVQWARTWSDPEPPQLRLLTPRAGDTLSAGALVVTFDAGAELSPQKGGMGAHGHHLHLAVDTVSLMAGPADLEHVEGTRYRWTTSLAAPGDRRVRLYWSDVLHRPLRSGSSRGADVHLTAPAEDAAPPAPAGHDAHAGHAP